MLRFWRDFFVTVLAACACLGILEAGLRLGGLRFDASLYTYDAERGFAFRRGATGWEVSEGDAYVRINADGMNDVEHSIEKPPGVVRIAVLGDSETAATHIDFDKGLVQVAQRKLRDERIPVELLNFAVVGYSLPQQYLTLRKVWKYHPDVIYLMLSGLTVPNVSRKLRLTEAPTPFYMIRDGKLMVDPAVRLPPPPDRRSLLLRDWFAQAHNDVRLLGLFRQAADEFRHAKLTQIGQWLRRSKGNSKAGPDNEDILLLQCIPPRTSEVESAWRVTEALMEEIQQETARHHARLVTISVGVVTQIIPDPNQRRAYLERLNATDLDYADRRFAAIARKMDVPFTAFAPYMLDFGREHHAVLRGGGKAPDYKGHFNTLGSEIAGTLLANQIREYVDMEFTPRQAAKAQ